MRRFGRGRVARRIVVGALLAAAVPLASGAAYEAMARRGAATAFPPPGKLANIGGRRIHIDCRGDGSPTVILEAGADTSGSTLWHPVMQAVSQTTRVCSYDRAGLMLRIPMKPDRNSDL